MQTASPTLYKVLLTGPSKVGKSSLLGAYTGREFRTTYKATIGVDFESKNHQTAAGNHVYLQIWDAAGDERYVSISSGFYRGTEACLVIFDLTNLPSFTDLPTFVQRAKDSAPEALIFIVGTHASSSIKQVQTDTAKEFATRQGFQYREVDASTGFGIEELFELVASSSVSNDESKQLDEQIALHVDPVQVEPVPVKNSEIPSKMQNILSLLEAVDSLFPSSEADSKSSVDLRVSMGDFDQHSSSTSSIKLCYQDSYETSHDRNNSNLSQEESAIVFTFIPNPSSYFSSSDYEEYFKEILDSDSTKSVLDMLSGNTFKWAVTAGGSLVTLTLKFATSSTMFGLIKPITDVLTKAGISPGALLELLFSEAYEPSKDFRGSTSSSTSSGAGLKAQLRIKAEMSKKFLFAVARILEKTDQPGPFSQLVSTFKKLHFDFEFDDIKQEVYDLFDQKLRKADAPADTFKDFETIKHMLLNPFILSKLVKKSPKLQQVLGEENPTAEAVNNVLPSLYTKFIEFFAGIDAIKFILGTEHSLVIKTSNIELIKLLPTAEDLIKTSKFPNVADLFKPETRVLLLGLDGSGKTCILYKLKLGEVVTTIPTIGFNVESIEYKNTKLLTWDVGGSARIRALWRHYLKDTTVLIYVVDSHDGGRLAAAKEELTKVLYEPELDNAILLVFCNKQDLPNALSVVQVTEQLGLNTLTRPWFIQKCCATTGKGLFEGLDWAVDTLNK